MASAESSKSCDENRWNCAMCLEHLKCPKLLPCSHTFCEGCLKDLVEHHPRGSFPCPSCREMVKVPQGGVSAFKNNFYLESLKENKMPMCKQEHEKPREIELYCCQCDACICLECKIKDHLNHYTEDVRMTAKTIKAKLDRDQMGLKGVISDFKKHSDKFLKEQQAVKDKKAAVEREIQHRYNLMVDEADRCREEALFSLDTVTASINSELDEIVKEMQKNLDELTKLHKRMERCAKSEGDGGLLVTAQDIYADALKREKVVLGLMDKKIDIVSRPVLHFSSTADLTLKTEEKFMGQVKRMDAVLKEPEFTVKKLFQCPQQTDVSVEIFSLCPRVDNTVWIAYDCHIPLQDGITSKHPDLYDIKGQIIKTDKSVNGRITFTHTDKGMGLQTSLTVGCFSTYAKSRRLYQLRNYLNGKADVISIISNDGNPPKILEAEVCQIKCGHHRAFDVDEDGIVYAVLEEVLHAPESAIRKVHIYHHKYEIPLTTYQPPDLPFQPSDVCFYKLAGRPVLLVSDEINDAIHVVGVEKGDLRFLGYLAAGSSLLIQPVALNTDVRGRLWVACRNGSVLCCEPVLR